MKTSLESILAASLGALKDLTPSMESDIGPVETLQTIELEQIQADAVAHIQNERYGDEQSLREVVESYLEENEQAHAQMRNDIESVRTTVQGVVSSMEMLATIASMESLDSGAVATANAALANIATTVGEEAPVVVTENDQITHVSMESVVDFVKKTLAGLKKWIKEKFDNMALHFRRGAITTESMRLRIGAVQKRLSSIPEEYGIPAKPLRYAPEQAVMLYAAGAPLPLDKKSLQEAAATCMKLLEGGIETLAPEATKRSAVLADALGRVIMAVDSNVAEDILKKAFKEASAEWPVEKLIKRDIEVPGGITFIDPSASYRTRYRDAEWIMELVRLLELNQAMIKYRRTGNLSTKADDIETLKGMLDQVIAIFEDAALSNYSYYTELSIAWREASKVYNRLSAVVQTSSMPQLNNELWRGLDVGVSGMFMILDKAFYQITTLQAPVFRLMHGLLYVVEEQAKAYAAVNR